MKLLTLARDLQRRKARERQGLFVAEGIRTVEDLFRSTIPIRGVLAGPQSAENARATALLALLTERRIPIETVDDRDFASASDTESPQGILAVGEVPAHTLASVPDVDPLRLLVLDAVQDPGNVGTIVRTAAALGVTATFSLPGTVDLWNAKVVRSGMGAHFHHPCVNGTWDELDAFRRERAVEIWAADAHGETVENLEPPGRLALIVGNEGGGLSAESRARAGRVVALSIGAGVDSINVAVATGILLYELRQ